MIPVCLPYRGLQVPLNCLIKHEKSVLRKSVLIRRLLSKSVEMFKITAIGLIFASIVHFSCEQEMTLHKSDPLNEVQSTTLSPLSLNGSRNRTQGQKDLLIVFDATGSMGPDLAQLRSAAIEIVNELSGKAEDPINNFVLSVFRDPGE